MIAPTAIQSAIKAAGHYTGAMDGISARSRARPGMATLLNTTTPGVVSNQPLTNVNPMYLTAVVSGSGYRVDNFRLVAA